MPSRSFNSGSGSAVRPVLFGLLGTLLLTSADRLLAATTRSVDDRGEFADIAQDAATGLSLIHRQIMQPWQDGAGPLPLFAGCAAAILLVWPLRVWLSKRVSASVLKRHHQTDLAIYGRAMATVVVTTLSFIFAGLLAFAGASASFTLLPETQTLAMSAFAGFVLTGLGLGLGGALRSSDAKDLRPVRLPSGLGRTIELHPAAAGLMLGLASVVDVCSRLLHASATSWTIAQAVLATIEAVFIARFLIHAGKARERQTNTAGPVEASMPAVFSVTAIAWLALAIAIGALCFGHMRFAMTILQQMMWSALALATAWVTVRFIDALVARYLGSERRVARFATGVVGVRDSQLQQAALIVTAFADVVVWLFAALLVLAPLHGEGGNVAEQLRPSPILDALRSLHLSPRTLATAVAVLVGGIVATRIAKGWLDRRFLPSTNLDVGARNSLVTGLGYLGVIAALIATSSTLGLQLEKITLIASALTVGIGFGLQAIIQNFVSGVILLFERPIKLGDWVSVSGSEGRVRRMRVRATEVVGDDGTIAIIPNSAFISSTVLNRSSARDQTSFDVTIKVSEAPSAQTARDILAAKIAGCPAIRSHPEPRFYLEALGVDSWTFRVRMQPVDDASQARTTSDLLFELSALSETGVKITVQ